MMRTGTGGNGTSTEKYPEVLEGEGSDAATASREDRQSRGSGETVRGTQELTWTQARDMLYEDEQDTGQDPGIEDLHSALGLGNRATSVGNDAKAQGKDTKVALTPSQAAEHEHFVRSVMFYEPEEQQDTVLGVGEPTPHKVVDHRTGRILEGS